MATIQFKRGSTATLQDIIPAAGEPVWDKQLQKLKVGDGVSAYKDLPYVGDDVDNASTELDSNSNISLFNFGLAEEGMSPVKQDGILKWTVLAKQSDVETIVAQINDDLVNIQQELIEHDNRLDELENILEDIHPEDIQAALDRIDTFDGQLDLIEDTLADLQNNVDEISDVADEAKELAQEAKDTADEAKETADEAKETADAAKEEADEAKETADQLDEQINGENGIEERLEALESNNVDFENDVIEIYGGSSVNVIINDHQYVEGE